LPKSTLLRFSKSGIVYYFDTNKKKVEKTTATSFMTQQDYYNGFIEDYLSKKVETKLGRIHNEFSLFNCKSLDLLNIDRNFTQEILDIILIQLIRNPNYAKSISGKFNISEDVFSNVMLNGFDCYKNNIHNGMNYQATALLNRTNKEFFLPSTHSYSVKHKGIESIILILSPKEAVVLINKHFYQSNYQGCYAEVTSIEEIDKMNYECLMFDGKYGVGKIIGNKLQLNDFIDTLQETNIPLSI